VGWLVWERGEGGGDAWTLGSLLYGGRSHLVTAEAEQYRYRPCGR